VARWKGNAYHINDCKFLVGHLIQRNFNEKNVGKGRNLKMTFTLHSFQCPRPLQLSIYWIFCCRNHLIFVVLRLPPIRWYESKGKFRNRNWEITFYLLRMMREHIFSLSFKTYLASLLAFWSEIIASNWFGCVTWLMTLKTKEPLLPTTARPATSATKFPINSFVALLCLIPNLQAMSDFGECGPTNGLFVPALNHQGVDGAGALVGTGQ